MRRVAAASLAVAVTSVAWGDGFVVGGGSLGAVPVSVDVTSLLNLTPGANYETFNATMSDWTDAGSEDFSVSVEWVLSDQPVVSGASGFDFPGGTKVYLDSGPAGNSYVFDYGPKDLTWSNFFDDSFDSNVPLYFNTRATFDFSSYGGFEISFNTDTPGPPASNDLGTFEDAPGGQFNVTDPLDAGGINWYSFELETTQIISLSTAGSSLTNSGVAEDDTELGLYDFRGDRIADNDDQRFSPGVFTSFIETRLDPGTYYVAVTGYDTFFGPALWDLTATSSSTGRTELTITGELVLTADFNDDGVVDLLDLDLLGANWEMAGAASTGDANGDGFVDLLDLDLLGQQWELGGAAFVSAAAARGLAVPEPGTLGLLAIGVPAGLIRRRRSE